MHLKCTFFAAKVLKVSEFIMCVYLFFLSQVTIDFLDYGGTDVVDKSMLRPLPVEFLQLPFQGIACTLQGMYENMLGK